MVKVIFFLYWIYFIIQFILSYQLNFQQHNEHCSHMEDSFNTEIVILIIFKLANRVRLLYSIIQKCILYENAIFLGTVSTTLQTFKWSETMSLCSTRHLNHQFQLATYVNLICNLTRFLKWIDIFPKPLHILQYQTLRELVTSKIFFFFGVGEAKNSPVWQNEHRHYERPFGAVFFLLFLHGKHLI